MNDCSIPVNQTGSVAFATSYSVVMLVGLPLNGLSLWIILKWHGLKSSNTVFMANLALSDFVLAVSLPLRIYYFATATWPFGTVACATSIILFRVNMYTSAVFITFINVDRLLAVVFPMRSRVLRTSRSSGIACAVTWPLFIALNVPVVTEHMKKANACNEVCFELSSEKSLTVGGLSASLIIFALLIVNIGCTAMVMMTLYRLQTDFIGRDKRRVMLIFGVNLVAFAAFFVPFSIVLFLMSLHIIEINRDFLKTTVCYANFSLCIDPLIYYFSIDAFWKINAEQTLEAQGMALGEPKTAKGI